MNRLRRLAYSPSLIVGLFIVALGAVAVLMTTDHIAIKLVSTVGMLGAALGFTLVAFGQLGDVLVRATRRHSSRNPS